jgi:hypothetical protein
MSNAEARGGFYRYDLDQQLSTLIGEYRQDREQYWENRLGKEEWSRTLEMQRSADDLANQIMKHAELLVSPSAAGIVKGFRQVVEEYRQRLAESAEQLCRKGRNKFPAEFQAEWRKLVHRELVTSWSLKDADSSLEADSPLRLLWERFCADLASEAIEFRVPDGARRLLLLMDLVTEASPTEQTALFLRHVSRCYVWGFDSECVILCRGAIDTAFRDAVSDELCETRRERPRHGFGLQDRIEAALPTLIDKAVYEAANRVNVRGSSAIHYDPEGCKDVLGTIGDTLRIISRLSS